MLTSHGKYMYGCVTVKPIKTHHNTTVIIIEKHLRKPSRIIYPVIDRKNTYWEQNSKSLYTTSNIQISNFFRFYLVSSSIH